MRSGVQVAVHVSINGLQRACFAIFLLILCPISRLTAMSKVKIKDKTFVTSIPEAEILKRIGTVAARINADMEGKTPVFLAVLNGSFMFASDLVRMITVPCEVSFVKFSSYSGTKSTGTVKQLIGLDGSLKGRDVIIVEDIVETGYTMREMLSQVEALEPNSVQVCTLLLKPDCLRVPLDIKYAVMEIPNDFIVGYGLDYDQQGRNLRDIYTIVAD